MRREALWPGGVSAPAGSNRRADFARVIEGMCPWCPSVLIRRPIRPGPDGDGTGHDECGWCPLCRVGYTAGRRPAHRRLRVPDAAADPRGPRPTQPVSYGQGELLIGYYTALALAEPLPGDVPPRRPASFVPGTC